MIKIIKKLFFILLCSILLFTQLGCPPLKIDEPEHEEPEAPTGFEVKQGTTDTEGVVSFVDNSTGEEVTITVLDATDDSPREGINVIYFDGNGYEAYYLIDSNSVYLPKLQVYPRNSNHVIKIVDGEYKITKFEDPSIIDAIWLFWQDITNSKIQNNWIIYNTTVSNSEFLAMTLLEIIGDIGIDIFINSIMVALDVATYGATTIVHIALAADSGDNWAKKISEILEIAEIEFTDPPQNWDYYKQVSYNPSMLTNQFGIKLVFPSQKPFITNLDVEVNGNEIQFSWTATDPIEYPDGMPDLTIYEGATIGSDLKYSYRITQSGEVYNGHNWTQYESNTFATVYIPDEGTYTFELRVKDEVENIGETTRAFTIGGNSPLADFTANTTSITEGGTVNFSDLSTNSPTSWLWDFGDGGTSTSKNPSNTYSTAGTYTVSMTATNAYGSDNETKNNYITVNEQWVQATEFPPWPARSQHTSVVFNGKIWIIGGLNDEGLTMNDVWYSSDGINWVQATASASWPARRGHTSVVYDEKMWVIGGSTTITSSGHLNDVWYSSDGINWRPHHGQPVNITPQSNMMGRCGV